MVTKKENLTAKLEAVTKKASEPKQPEYLTYLLDLTQPVADAEYLLSIGNIDTFPKGELIALNAKAKNGKSQFIYYLIATMLAGQPRGSVSPLQDSYKILLFDTEQSAASLQKGCYRAMRFAGLEETQNDDRFCPFSLRKVDYRKRLDLIKSAIREMKPTFVVIDGIRDLIQDFNNITESANLIQELLSLATDYKCTILCVLHQNKGYQDENMRGHLGTELLNKVTDSFKVEKIEKTGVFKVSCTDSRNVPCPALAFSIDEEGDFCIEDVPVKDKVDKDKAANEKMEQIFRECFSNVSGLRQGVLKKAYMEKSGKSDSTAERTIKSAIEKGILLKRDSVYSLSGTPST